MMFRPKDPFRALAEDVAGTKTPWWMGPKLDRGSLLGGLRYLALLVFGFHSIVLQLAFFTWLAALGRRGNGNADPSIFREGLGIPIQWHPIFETGLFAGMFTAATYGIYRRNWLGWWGVLFGALFWIQSLGTAMSKSDIPNIYWFIFGIPTLIYLALRFERSGIPRLLAMLTRPTASHSRPA